MSGVAVDECHIDLVKSFIKSHKPSSILELGVGSGNTTKGIIEAVKYNESKDILPGYRTPTITLVDNWVDWGFKKPDIIDKLGDSVTVIESSELDFIFNTRNSYDFIFSDADHWNADKWFDYVYDNGILFYHDVSTMNPLPNDELRFPNLEQILIKCKMRGISHVHLDKSSMKHERCFRGLLVIFKGQLMSTTIHNKQLLVSS
jgi:hypothetical protein